MIDSRACFCAKLLPQSHFGDGRATTGEEIRAEIKRFRGSAGSDPLSRMPVVTPSCASLAR